MSEKIASDRNDELEAAEPRTSGELAPETRTAESDVNPEMPREEGTSGMTASDDVHADEKPKESADVTDAPSGEPEAALPQEEPADKEDAPKETSDAETSEEPSKKGDSESSKGGESSEPPSDGAAPADGGAKPDPVSESAPVRKKSLAGKIFLGLLVLVLLAAAAAGVLYTQGKKKIFEEPVPIREGAGTEVVREGVTLRAVDIRVRPGDTMRSVVLRLRDAGFELDENLMRFAAAEELEGKTAEMDAEAFAKAVGLPEGMSPEGWFAPDTYRYSSGTDDLPLWRQAYRRQKETLETAWATRPADSVLKTPYEALILASIIEKETSVDADRTKVSSVFHNRLKRGMPLQTDPTVIYGIGPDFNGNLTRADLRRPTPYNTYTMNKLPPTPIAMPSKASIEAAVHPADTKYLYFVARGDGTSEFSRTLAEHNRAVRRFILNKNQRSKTKDSK